MDTKTKIKECLVSLLKVKPEELKDDVKLYDGIGVDSTEMVEVVIALGKLFNLKLSPSEITKNSTINEIVRVIESKSGKQ
jgi:acyl carrier protein